MRILLWRSFLLVSCWLLIFNFNVCGQRAEKRQYDQYFDVYTQLHFGIVVSPRWVKAVALAESALNPKAKSWVGASGLMQFMPGTWSGVAPEPWKSRGSLDPEAAIFVGALYLKQLYGKFKDVPENYHRKAFTNASYNSGLGWIIKARAKCYALRCCVSKKWDSPNVENNLVTRADFQRETRGYVVRIRKFETQLFVAGEFF